MRLAQLAAGISVVMLGLQVWRLAALSSVPCVPVDIESVFLVTLALIPPYLGVLVGPRPTALGRAVWWGGLNGVLAGAAIVGAVAPLNRLGLATHRDVLGWSVFAGLQFILVMSVWYDGVRLARSALQIAMYLGLLLLVYAWTFSIYIDRRPPADLRAIASLRQIIVAQLDYRGAHPDRGYASTLEDLRAGIPPHSLLSAEGYGYTLAGGARNESGQVTSYQAWATHDQPRGFCRAFFTDESGTIRFTTEDRPATAADSPIQ